MREEASRIRRTAAIDIVGLGCQTSRVPMDPIDLIHGRKVMVGAIACNEPTGA